MRIKHDLESMPDERLLCRLVELLRQARVSEADLVATSRPSPGWPRT